MKPNYSWETDEEGEWELTSPTPTAPGRNPRRMFFVLLVLVVVTIALISNLFERRLAAREAIVRQNVIAAHRTWEQAVARQDLELFSSLISRSDADWYQSQRRLLMSGRVIDRGQFDLTLTPAFVDQFEVVLDSNWRQAELRFPQQYVVGDGDEKQSIILDQTYVYHIRGSRWQVASPSVTFWGDTRTREFGSLLVTYAERDAAVVEKMAGDLAGEIDRLCAQHSEVRECSTDGGIPIVFETDPESLLALGDPDTPVLQGRTFLLPTPTLVGLPIDDEGYKALYDGYTGRIVRTLRNDLALPVPLPDQELAVLCFPSYEEGLSLFSYQPRSDTWTQQSEPKRFSSIQALRDDSAVVLRAGFPGVEIAHLELVLKRGGEEVSLFKEGTTELSARLDGIPIRPQNDSLLLSSVQGSTGLTSYRLLPLESCNDGACDVRPLDGFPLWSPRGDRSLVLVGSELYVGDEEGVPNRYVGRAFSPFWMTDDEFGYVRLRGNTTNESPDMELVLYSVETGQERLLIKSADLLDQVEAGLEGAFRIMYVTASPTDPNLIFLAGTPVRGGGGRFYVLRLQLQADTSITSDNVPLIRSEVILALDDLPVGDPSTLTPTGYPPFSITADGRKLMVFRFADPVTNTWVLYLYDVAGGDTQVRTLNYPIYPAPFPFYDWSADGNWLLLVDNGFLRLVAPDYDYERIITHDFAACRYPAWIDASALTTGVRTSID